jgi:hypothetical protein
MYDHNEHDLGETDDQPLASVFEALAESVAKIQFVK